MILSVLFSVLHRTLLVGMSGVNNSFRFRSALNLFPEILNDTIIAIKEN